MTKLLKSEKEEAKEAGYLTHLPSWWKNVSEKEAPDVHLNHLVLDGKNEMGLKQKISRRITFICNEHKDKYKFGKSGQPFFRATGTPYVDEPYKKLFLLYRSKDKFEISKLEVYYIKRDKHLKKNENERESEHDKMVPYKEHFYLYIVVQ